MGVPQNLTTEDIRDDILVMTDWSYIRLADLDGPRRWTRTDKILAGRVLFLNFVQLIIDF